MHPESHERTALADDDPRLRAMDAYKSTFLADSRSRRILRSAAELDGGLGELTATEIYPQLANGLNDSLRKL